MRGIQIAKGVNNCFSITYAFKDIGGEYRNRTDDLLTASQTL